MKKILVLRIYNSTPDYDAMKDLHYKNDDSIFVTFNANIDTKWKYSESERLLEVRGSETYIPGILEKTLVALRASLQLFDFDFVVRSNMSTVIDMRELSLKLEAYSRDEHLYGGHIWPMERTDGNLHFTTVEWLGVGMPLVTGTGIILSRKTCQYIVDNRSQIDTSVVDDVSIAMMMEKLENKVLLSIPRSEETGLQRGVCFYRFRTDSPRPWLGIFDSNQGRAVDIQSVAKQYYILKAYQPVLEE